jgi:hypothetical protein
MNRLNEFYQASGPSSSSHLPLKGVKSNLFKQITTILISGKPATVAHAYNPSYSGGSDQRAHGSKPAQANSLRNPISKKKKNHHKQGLVE